ncbi:hypothetical protein [Nonomuraea insulae]|uniref:Uncharacterized protein n=1 Tax=Nonomuraea insulae TaxID=1616787 RepID=A0ABW1DBV8_9ACTN
MTFGKLAFLQPFGATTSYQHHGGKYAVSTTIDTSRLHHEIRSEEQP